MTMSLLGDTIKEHKMSVYTSYLQMTMPLFDGTINGYKHNKFLNMY